MLEIAHFVIDPPWPQRKGGSRAVRPNQGRQLDYATLSIESIFTLLDAEVLPLAAAQHNVFLWSIDKYLKQSEEEMLRRGYRLHARVIWDKRNGVAPAFTVRYTHEYLLWFYKPKMLKVAENSRGKYPTVMVAPARQHSRKPDEAYAMIDAIYPAGERMDVFSREHRDGWLQWGDQTNYFAKEAERA